MPSGTIHDDVNWNGSYYRNDGQMVTTADAAALARALRAALEVVNTARAQGGCQITRLKMELEWQARRRFWMFYGPCAGCRRTKQQADISSSAVLALSGG